MAHGKINLITPPDNLFNFNPSYLLVKPSSSIKLQFKQIFGQSEDEINVYIYDEEDTDLAWLLSASRNSDIVLIDIDHCDEITKHFISFLLIHPRSFYITNDDQSPWKLLSKNRVFHVDDIIEYLYRESEMGPSDDDEEDED